MSAGWVWLRVKNPKEMAQWCNRHLGVEVLGSRHIEGGETQALGFQEKARLSWKLKRANERQQANAPSGRKQEQNCLCLERHQRA